MKKLILILTGLLVLMGCKKEIQCDHVWKEGVSQEYAKKNLGSITDPKFYYTCTVCLKELGYTETEIEDGVIIVSPVLRSQK